MAHPAQEPGLQIVRFRAQHAGNDFDTRRPQPGDAGAIDARVRVVAGNDDARDPGRDKRLGARRGLPGVVARLKRDVGVCAARGLAGHDQRLGLGMRAAAGLGAAAADDAAIPHYHAANGRVGPGRPQAAPGQGECGAHVRRLDHAGYVGSSSEPRKASKSFASRKLR